MVSFKKNVQLNCKRLNQMMTTNGDAKFKLVNSLDPFSEGDNFRFVFFPLL